MLEYTSARVSRELIEGAVSANPSNVADFCAGKGSLILAAMKRWPSAKYFTNDVDPATRHALTGVEWMSGNFLSTDFDSQVSADFPKYFDVVLLNPPFSFHRTPFCHGRGRFDNICCSVAFAFLFTSLEYLKQTGELLAILPTSTLKSERDELARQSLRKYFNCKIISGPSYDRFPGLDVSTYLVSIRPKCWISRDVDFHREALDAKRIWSITRGNISVRRNERVAHSGVHGWIHTTSICSSKIVERYKLPRDVIVKDAKILPSNSLIIPRVGKIQPGDLIVSKRGEILSDCLMGVTFDDPTLAPLVFRAIGKEFESFKEIYGGTGAPYTTHEKVSQFIDNVFVEGVVCIDGVA